MKKALGYVAAALMFTAIWPFLVGGHDGGTSGSRFQWLVQLLGQVMAPGRDLTTIVLLLLMLVAQCLAVAGLASLLQPLGRALLQSLSLHLPQKL